MTTDIFITFVSLLHPHHATNNPPILNTIQKTNMRIISSLTTSLSIHFKNLTARRNFFISFTSAFLIFKRLFCLTPFYVHKHTYTCWKQNICPGGRSASTGSHASSYIRSCNLITKLYTFHQQPVGKEG